MFLSFSKSEPHYSYKLYSYKKVCISEKKKFQKSKN